MSTVIRVTTRDFDLAIAEVKKIVEWKTAIFFDQGYTLYHTSRSNMPINFSEMVEIVSPANLNAYWPSEASVDLENPSIAFEIVKLSAPKSNSP